MHDWLAASARDARFNPLRPSTGEGRDMLLNAAYLVAVDAEQPFRAAVAELEQRHAADGVTLELTGPWPPYNFAAAETSEP
jgi:hypothetical protein